MRPPQVVSGFFPKNQFYGFNLWITAHYLWITDSLCGQTAQLFG